MSLRSATTLSETAELVISEHDYDRLHHLLRSDTRWSPLRGELDRGHVVPPAEVPKGVVTMHSRVRVRHLG
jgi:hypothetical protein